MSQADISPTVEDWSTFLDKLKGAGIAIANEEILRSALSSNDTWKQCFIHWVERGRANGVTFHISAAGLDQFALIDAFIDAGMTGIDAKRVLENLRPDPAPEVQSSFKARAES